MKKYFVVSDIHSFATNLKYALFQAGFRKTNKDHVIIVCGDIFDRGDEAVEVFDFFRTIPKKRTVFVRGNHEQLYLELLNKRFPEGHDLSNRTVETFCQIAGFPLEVLDDWENFSDTWQAIKEDVKNSEVTKWLQSKEWRNYYELGPYVFVHSFVPTRMNENMDIEYDPNWRKNKDWYDAVWGCPWAQYKNGYFKEEGKVLVCGHWHTSDFYLHLNYDKNHNGDIYWGDGLIGIDGGVRLDFKTGKYLHPQNVLVINSNFSIDKEKSKSYNKCS